MASKWPIKHIVFTRHAMTQMFSRSISIDEIETVISHHEIVMDYPDDRPYPSRLLLGRVGKLPVHVVLGYNTASGTGYVITAYRPDPLQWGKDFKRKKTP